MISGRWRLGVVAFLMIGALFALAACGDDEGGQTPGPGQTPSPAANLAADQTFRVNLGGEPTTLDPQIVAFSTDLTVVKQLWRGLFYYDGPELNVVAAAAVEVPTVDNGGISADGLTYTIKVRDDLTWSDGTALTANDFEYSIRRLFDPEAGATGYYYSFYTAIAGAEDATTGDAPLDQVGVTAIDATTLEIKLAQKLPTLLTLLALWPAYPVRQDIIEAEGDTWTEAGKLIGNGPFVLSEWAHEDHITLEANPNYWGEDKPTLQKIVFSMAPEESQELISYDNDEFDISRIPLPDTARYEGDAEQLKYAELTTFAWEFNNTVAPFDNPDVRKAFSAATDRETYIQSVRGGVGLAATSWMPPGIPGYDANRGSEWAFNKDKAQQALTDAGFPGGEGLPKVTLTIAESEAGRLSADFLDQQINQNLGVDIEIEVLEESTYEDRYLASDFQVVLGGWGADYADPENWLPQLFGTDAGLNQYKYSNNDVDTIFDEAAVELDNDARIALYQQAESIIIDDDMGVAPIFHRTRNWLIKPWLSGMVTTGLDSEVPGDFFFTKLQILEH